MRGRSAAIVLLGFLTIDTASAQPTLDDAEEVARGIVQQLRSLPPGLSATGGTGPTAVGERPRIPASEVLRDELYRQLHDLGPSGVMALAEGYHDADVRLRQNVALALGVLGGGYWQGLEEVDISLALPALIDALTDPDPTVRAWSAQAIGYIGAEASSAVPALILLLRSADESSRNSASIALRGIGPAANGALPALRDALSDESADVRRFAEMAIGSIER